MKILLISIFLIFSIYAFTQENANSNYEIISEKLITATDEEKSELYCKLSEIYLDSSGNGSLIFAQKALNFAEKTKSKEQIAKSNLQLASVFMVQSDWDKALEFLRAAEKELKGVQNPILIHSIYNQFGVCYRFAGQLDQSLDYYTKGLNVARKSNNYSDIMASLNNIGNVYILQNKYDAALQIYKSAEQECLLSNNPGNHLASIYNNIGYIYFVTNDFEKARIAWNKSINSLDKNKDFQRYAVLLNNLAELEIKTGNYAKAEENIKTADSIHQKHKFKESQKNLYFTSYQLYYNIGKYKEAVYYLNRYIAIKDSIYDEEFNLNVSKLKAESDFVKLENESLKKDNKIKRKNLMSKILIIVIISITIFIILLFIILTKFKQLNTSLKSLNQILEVKNEEINNNLQYAKLIQIALTNQNITDNNISLLDKPKFAVGGDFFMSKKHSDSSFYILGDCTGHGTSGAILSVFAIGIIDKILASNISPEIIANELNIRFSNSITESYSLKHESLTVSIIQIQKNKVFYAGSRQKIWHFDKQNNSIIEYKTDSFLIGQNKENKFILKNFEVKAGDIIFMSSDGFADQFGEGGKGKYKYERFRQMLINWTFEGITNTDYPDKELRNWQGKAEQTDDIMVMAIKI